MKLYPRTKTARVRAALLVALLAGVCWSFNLFALTKQLAQYEPREGDVLFQSLPHNDLVDAIEGVSQSPWSHCGIVVKVDGRWKVAEALGEVRHEPLATWIIRGRRGVFAAYRPNVAEPKFSAPTFREALSKALRPYMGRPYDIRYAPGDEEIYCSELIFKAYKDAFGVELGRWESLGELNWRPHADFIRAIERGPVPLGRPMITPVGLTRSRFLTLVHPGPSKAKSVKQSTP